MNFSVQRCEEALSDENIKQPALALRVAKEMQFVFSQSSPVEQEDTAKNLRKPALDCLVTRGLAHPSFEVANAVADAIGSVAEWSTATADLEGDTIAKIREQFLEPWNSLDVQRGRAVLPALRALVKLRAPVKMLGAYLKGSTLWWAGSSDVEMAIFDAVGELGCRCNSPGSTEEQSPRVSSRSRSPHRFTASSSSQWPPSPPCARGRTRHSPYLGSAEFTHLVSGYLFDLEVANSAPLGNPYHYTCLSAWTALERTTTCANAPAAVAVIQKWLAQSWETEERFWRLGYEERSESVAADHEPIRERALEVLGTVGGLEGCGGGAAAGSVGKTAKRIARSYLQNRPSRRERVRRAAHRALELLAGKRRGARRCC